MATIRDVAAQARVSVATVSRVLNSSGYADAATRARVLQAAADLNYQRNVNWSRLKSQSSQTILFLLGNREGFNVMHMRLLEACERTLRRQGYDLIFTRHEYAAGLSAADLPMPRVLEQAGAVDGVLLAGVHHQNLLDALEKRGLPFTLMANNLEPAPAQNAVLYDDRGAVAEAVAYLQRMGHRRIAFIGNTRLSWFRRRHDAYQQAMRASGATPMAVCEDWHLDSLDYGRLATAQLLREAQVPTAILGGNGDLASGAWKELTQRKIAIPGQMSLIGMGDRAEFAILEPAVTAISVLEDQLGERLATMLLDRLAAPGQPVPSAIYPCKLVERASCAAPIAEIRPQLAAVTQRKHHL